MAANVDRRIIQMQFENRQFEKNIAKSTKSVEELKKAMNFEETSKGLKKFADSTKGLSLAGFDKFTDNIQKLTDKFTGLGTISELVLSQIRRGIESVARDISNFVTSMTTVQVSAGMEKYNTLNKSVQTIKAATGESEETVYKVLERLSQYTDQTSYNFADMAQNIGKFTSVGISLTAAEKQMEGIANWAARSGAGINEASRAMYNLSQAMGVGKLTKIDWKSIENAGMATKEFKEQLIQSGVALGTLIEKNGQFYTKEGNVEVNYKNVADTLAKGWASSQVLSTTLEKYYFDDLYYENENQEALLKLSDTQKTAFDKMIASGNKLEATEWKSLESMGVITTEVREKLADLGVTQGKLTKETKNDGKVVYKTVNKTGKQIEFTLDKLEDSLSSGWFDKGIADAATSVNDLAKESYEAAQKCLTFTDVLGAWKDQISSGWMQSFTIIFGELSEAMEFFSDVCNRVGEGLGNIIDFRNKILESWSANGGRQSLIDLIVGNYGDNATKGAFGFLDILEGAGNVIKEGFKNFIYLFMDPTAKNLAEKNPIYLEEWLGYKLSELTQNVGNFMKNIKKFFTESVAINGKTTNRLEVIQNVVNGIAGAMKLGYDIVTNVIDFIGAIGLDLSPGLDSLLGFFGKLGQSIYNTSQKAGDENSIHTFFTNLRNDVQPLTDSINILLTTFAKLLTTIFGLEKDGAEHTSTLHSIGELIRNVARIISSVAGPVIKFFADLIEIINDLVSGNLSFDNLPAIGDRIKIAFNNMISGLPQPIQKVAAYIKDLYSTIKELFATGFTTGNLTKLGDLLKKPFVKAFDMLPDGVKKKFDEISKKICSFFQNLWNKIIKFWNDITGKNPNSGGQSIIQQLLKPFTGNKNQANKAVSGQSIFDTIKDWIKDKFEALLTFIQTAVGNVGGTANSFGKKISDLIDKLKKINLSKVLLWLMGGLGLAAIVLTIVKIYKMFKMLAEGISTISDAIKNGINLKLNDSDKKIESFGDKMLKIAGAIAILTACIVVIGNMDAGMALRGIMYVITLMAALVLMSYSLKKIYGDMDWKSGIAIFLGLIGTAVAIGLLTDALVKIGQMNFGQFLQSVLGLAAIIIALSFIGRLSKGGQFKFENLSGMIAMALSISILIAALSLIKNATLNQLITMGGSLVVLLGILYAFMVLVSKANTSMAGSGMTQLIALAGAIAILILALGIIKNANLKQLLTMAGSLVAILGILWLFMKITSKMSMAGAGLVQLIALAGAIAVLMFALVPLALLPFERLKAAILAVVAIIAVMAIFMLVIKKTTLAGSGLVQLIALAGSIVILMLAIVPLALLPIDKLRGAIKAVIAIIVTLAAFMILINKFGGGTLSGKGMLGFVAVAVAIAVLVYALMPLAALQPQQLKQFILGLLGVMFAISLVIKSLKGLDLKSAVGGLLILLSLTVLILAFAAALHDLKDVDFTIIIAFAAGLAIMCVGFAKAVEILSKLDPLKALKGIGLLAVLLAAVVAVIGIMFSLIAPLIGAGLSAMLDSLSGSLNYMTVMLESFGSTISGMDENAADKGTSMIKKLKQMFENLTGFSKYTESINAFSTALFDLSTGLEIFQGHTSTILDPSKNNGLKLIQELASVAPMIDVLAKADINNLTSTLTGLGGAMMLYAEGANQVTGFGTGNTPDVTAAVDLLKAISDSLVQNGGFVIPTNMPDEEAIGLFGAQLAALAGALIKFEEAGKGLGTGTDEALRALDFFSDLKVKLTATEFAKNIGAAIRTFATGENAVSVDEMAEFGKNIEQLGLALNRFAASTTHIDKATGKIVPVNYDVAIKALTSFSDLESKLPKIGGIKSWWEGNQQELNDLGGQIETLGKNLAAFAVSVKGDGTDEHPGFNAEEIQGALDVTDQMIDIMESMKDKLPRVGGLWNILGTAFIHGRDTSLEDISTQMGKLGEGIGEFGSKISGKMPTNASEITTALDAVDGIVELVMHIASADKQVYSSNLNQYAESLNTFLDAFLNGIKMQNGQNDFYSGLEALIEIMQWISDELDKAPEINLDNLKKFEILTQALNNLTSIDLSKTADFENVGLSIITGMANGITKNTSIITSAAESAAVAAYNAAMKRIKAHSPSRLFMEVGGYIGQGMAIGMDNSVKTVSDSASGMGEVALDSARDMLGLISRIMAEGTDATPTIAPILDMTNIDAGMADFRNSLNGYGINLDTAFSAGRAAQIGTSSYADAEALKPDYSGIYQKMENLGIQIQQMGQEIRNMKLVLDTGAVAGGIVDILDEEFGRRSFYASRG